MRSLLTAASLVTLLALASTALAAPDEDARARAAQAYRRAVAAHDRGDLVTAAREFALADAIAPNPVALRAAVDAAIDADDPALGAELLERANRGPVDGPLAQSLEAARKRFAGRAGRVRVVCPERATCLATIDGAPLDVSGAQWTRTGQHTVVLQVDGASETKLVTVGPTDVVQVAPAPKASASPPAPAPAPAPVSPPSTPPADTTPSAAPPPEPSAGLPRAVVLATGALTLGAGAVAVVFATGAGNTHEDFVASGCPTASAPSCEGLASDGRSAQTRANVMFAVTGGLAVTTAVIGIFFTDWGGKKSGATAPRPPAPAFGAIVPGGALAGWSGRF